MRNRRDAKPPVISPPYPPQKEFYTASERRIAYGGARGGGKSYAMRSKLIMLALYYAGIQILLLRRTFPELRENHILAMRAMLNGIAAYRDTNKEFTFPNGSRIKLGYLQTDADVLQYQGQAYEVIGMDEATQFTEYQYAAMTECCRLSGTMRDDFIPRMYFTCNPGGVGHAWVKRLFIDRRYREGENPDDYRFIPAKVYDNRFLMENNPEYIATLEALPPRRRAAMLEGKWDVFDGQFFDCFVDDPAHYADGIHTHVIDPLSATDMDGWTITRSFDWGYSKPFACQWWACDYSDRVYNIAELYGTTGEPDVGVRWDDEKIFREIAAFEKSHSLLAGKNIYAGVADPSIWDASRGVSIAEVAERCGVGFVKGDNARIAGWQQMIRRMAFDAEGRPKLYIFRNCKHFIRTLPELIHSKTTPEDIDTTGEDHLADAARYFCQSRPVQPVMPKEQKKYTGDPAHLYRDGIWRQ